MIINCRPSSPRKTRVFWRAEEKETISVGRRNIVIKAMVTKVKEFENYADANGFAQGLEKRGVFVEEIQMVDQQPVKIQEGFYPLFAAVSRPAGWSGEIS